MLNINAYQPVVHEKKIFEDLSKFSLFCPLLGSKWGQPPLFEQIWIPIYQACFLPTLVEIGLVVLEKKSFKGKSWRRTDDGRCARHKLSWPAARWANKYADTPFYTI